jgi:prenyltransferase beta subunit
MIGAMLLHFDGVLSSAASSTRPTDAVYCCMHNASAVEYMVPSHAHLRLEWLQHCMIFSGCCALVLVRLMLHA